MAITVTDLAEVVYSSGNVFDGLKTSRRDTEDFLRSGSIEGVFSRADLALLQDLRDVAQFVIDHHHEPIDACFVQSVNAQLTRAAAIEPGRLRTIDTPIRVNTRHGRHVPEALDDQGLQRVIDQALTDADLEESSLELFVSLAKAQPFQDGNKRTALFVANARLIGSHSPKVLTIPVDENDPSLAEMFIDQLARAYVFDEHDGVKAMLRTQGLQPVLSPRSTA